MIEVMGKQDSAVCLIAYAPHPPLTLSPHVSPAKLRWCSCAARWLTGWPRWWPGA